MKTKSIEDKLDDLLIRVETLEIENTQLRHENHALKDRLRNYETPKNS